MSRRRAKLGAAAIQTLRDAPVFAETQRPEASAFDHELRVTLIRREVLDAIKIRPAVKGQV